MRARVLHAYDLSPQISAGTLLYGVFKLSNGPATVESEVAVSIFV